jgi:hypothetical protein
MKTDTRFITYLAQCSLVRETFQSCREKLKIYTLYFEKKNLSFMR